MTYEEIYEAVKQEFVTLTGKQNYKIYANKYFIPRFPVFKIRLDHACTKYSLDDKVKVKDVILNHVRDSVKKKFPKFTRTVEYYIFGQNGKDCQLADDYENFEDNLKQEEIEKLGIKKNKDLFG